MSEKNLAIPAAIIAAGALIGLGVFFGLRERAPQANSDPAKYQVTSPITSVNQQRAPPVVDMMAVQQGVSEQISQILDAKKDALRNTCWKSAVAADQSVKPARWVFNFTFGPDGKQIVRGIAEQRGTGSAELTQCVTSALVPFEVKPPGVVTSVDVPFQLP
jgi:hypothetical protein